MSNVGSKNDVANSASVAEPSPVFEIITISALLPDDAMSGKLAFDVVANVFDNVFVTIDFAVCFDPVWRIPVLDAIDGVVVDVIEGGVASVAVVDTVSKNSVEDVDVIDAVVAEVVVGVVASVVVVEAGSFEGVEDVVVINVVAVDVVAGVVASAVVIDVVSVTGVEDVLVINGVVVNVVVGVDASVVVVVIVSVADVEDVVVINGVVVDVVVGVVAFVVVGDVVSVTGVEDMVVVVLEVRFGNSVVVVDVASSAVLGTSVICIIAIVDCSSELSAVVVVGIFLGDDVTLEIVKNSIESSVN